MTRAGAAVRDERGIAVVLGLIALMTLTALVLAFLSVSSYEPQIASNLVEGTKARYVAEAGIESTFDTLVNDTNWNAYLAAASCAAGSNGAVVGAQNTPLPGLTAASGTYTVWIRNDCQAGDSTLTGVTVEPNTNGATDTNDHVILTATGTFRNATRTISVVVNRVPNLVSPGAPPSGQINAALAFPGYQADTAFTGNSFVVDGRNHDLNDNVIEGSSVYGISVGPENQYVASGGPVMHHEAAVEASVTGEQVDNVIGKDQSGAVATATGNSTIAAGALTSQSVVDFVNAAKSVADVKITSTQASPASFNNVGSSCSGNYQATSCWGTAEHPKIVYVQGTIDSTSAFNALSVAGDSTGYGILIVEDGDFTIRGNFRWEGPVIVTGGYVGVGIMGGGNQEILGALISNETATNEAPGFYEGVVQGNAKVNYSRATLDSALNLLRDKIPSTGGTGYIKVNMYSFQER